MSDRPLRVGIISANWGVKCHLPAWRAVKGVEVVAICTSREETATAAARANGIPRAYWNYREMAADPDIDLIDVGTRPALRYHMLKAALEAGKHVYAGVPFAANADQAAELVQLAESRGLKGVSDAYFEYIPAHQEMKHRIDRDDIGELFSVSLELQINLFNPPVESFPYLWFADKLNGASVLRNLGTHSITLLRSLFGEIDKVVGREAINLPEWQVPDIGTVRSQVSDTATALLQFRRGGTATINLSWVAAGAVGWRMDVYGSKGRLTVCHAGRFPNGKDIKLYGASISEPQERELPVSAEFTHSPNVAMDHGVQPPPCYPMALSFHRLKHAIDSLGDGSPSLSDALHVERVVDAIVRSEQSGRWEHIERADTRVFPGSQPK